MSETRQKLIHLHSSTVKVPQVSDLNYGEIAIQYASSAPVMYLKDSNDNIVKFIDSGAITTILSNYVTNETLTGSYATSASTVAAIDAVAAKLTNVYTYKGSVTNYSDLPSSNLTAGDVYNVENANGNIPPGTNYAWNGTAWDSLGGSIDLSNYATTGSVSTLETNLGYVSAATENLLDSAHTHDNQTVLDGIDLTDVESWDEAAASAQNHTNKTLLDGIDATKVSNWDDAATNSHTHANKSVLDGISDQDVSDWNGAVSDLSTHTGNTDIHVTTAQTASWDAKQDAINDLTDIRNNASSGATAYSEVTAHTADTTIHVTQADKDKWNTSAHTHSNKALLDTYSQSESDLADAVSKKHNHANSAALETITSEKIAGWDEAAASAHTHENMDVLTGISSTDVSNWDSAHSKAHEHSNKDLLDTYTQTETDLADAVSKKHSHTNADVLDGITSADTQNWDNAAASAHTHANMDVLTGITSQKVANWDSAYTVSQNALIGIETGKESGAAVNNSNELDFSSLYIDCGTY